MGLRTVYQSRYPNIDCHPLCCLKVVEGCTSGEFSSGGVTLGVKAIPLCSAKTDRHPGQTARGLLTTDHVILNHGQVTWMTPELEPLSPNYHTTPTGKRFNSQQI
ncbi:hypothetical protein TNCV_1417551 [Trichonephila clavipes]|nr:hypothetical protein TNCV_1417551 [Trichonephila clavipes]